MVNGIHTWFVNTLRERERKREREKERERERETERQRETCFLSGHYYYPVRLLLIVSLLSYLHFCCIICLLCIYRDNRKDCIYRDNRKDFLSSWLASFACCDDVFLLLSTSFMSMYSMKFYKNGCLTYYNSPLAISHL